MAHPGLNQQPSGNAAILPKTAAHPNVERQHIKRLYFRSRGLPCACLHTHLTASTSYTRSGALGYGLAATAGLAVYGSALSGSSESNIPASRTPAALAVRHRRRWRASSRERLSGNRPRVSSDALFSALNSVGYNRAPPGQTPGPVHVRDN